MGHWQPATLLETDNGTANGVINNTMKQKESEAIDVQFRWLRDQTKQGQFCVCWDSGKHNFDNFCTKCQPVAHHKLNGPIPIMSAMLHQNDESSEKEKH